MTRKPKASKPKPKRGVRPSGFVRKNVSFPAGLWERITKVADDDADVAGHKRSTSAWIVRACLEKLKGKE